MAPPIVQMSRAGIGGVWVSGLSLSWRGGQWPGFGSVGFLDLS